MKEMFGEFGKVVSVTIVKDNLNRSKGFGFVEVRLVCLLASESSINLSSVAGLILMY